ncbi:MAG: hypothetical protein LBQ75_07980 [Zoogloeaceae bacterium]|jgi:hypothetical protein|nr:hypothetical protein [Zoogloeaceae bacterium]
MFILESVMRAIKNLRLGALCLSFILTTGCTTIAEPFSNTFCQGLHLFGGGPPEGIWETVTYPVCLVGLAVLLPVHAVGKSIEYANKERRTKESKQKLSDRIKAGDLAASEKCVLYACYHEYSFPNFSETRRRAAETVLKAYQDEPEPNLKTQALLIFAHDFMDGALKDPESRRTHLEAIVRFGESKELWDAVKDPDFKSSKYGSYDRFEESKGISRFYIKEVQEKVNEVVIELLIMDQNSRVAGDPYQPFVCGDLAPYQKAADLAKVKKDEERDDPPCEEAERKWGERTIKQVKERIESGDLAAAERCLLDCANIKDTNSRNWKTESLRRLAARSLIKAYESLPELDSHQHEMLEKARALNPEARD